MDIFCPKCGEPWDHDAIHDRVKDAGLAPLWGTSSYDSDKWSDAYNEVAAEFQRDGCPALGGECGEPSDERDSTFGLTRQEAAGALYDILGDDMDGAAAMLEDMGF